MKRAAESQKEEFPSAAVEAVKRDFYVDDCLTSCNTTQEAKQMIQGITDLLSRRGMQIVKWISSDPTVLLDVPVERWAKSVQQFQVGDELPEERVLGMLWEVEGDQLRYAVAQKETKLTRRGVLSAVSSLFDPLGLVAPVLLG